MADRTIVFDTTKGTIKVELDEVNAPITTENFVELVNRAFYNGLTFHRYVAGFVLQGGCPDGNGTGNSGKQIVLETTGKNRHKSAGTIAMARSQQRNSASSQFYFTLASAPHLDGDYATFGKVTEGMETVLALRSGDKMLKVFIEEV